MDGRSTRWIGHADAQRDRIVASAIELIEAGNGAPSLVEIGRHAGIARSAVYRHFADKQALDEAVQRRIFRDFAGVLLPLLGTDVRAPARDSFRNAIDAYVSWAATHPLLHQRAVLDPTADGPLERGLDAIAGRLAVGMVAWFESLGARLSDADRAAADPLAHGMVGAVFAAVRRWVDLGTQVPNREHMVDLLTESVMRVVEARLRDYGIEVARGESSVRPSSR